MIARQAWLWTAMGLAVAVAGCRSVPDSEDYRWGYTVTNGTVTITNYTGSGETMAIPSRINGLPVTSVGTHAFFRSTSLTNVLIGNGVRTIGDSAFFGCAGLTNIAIPASVNIIGEDAFRDCNSLEAIVVDARNRFNSAADGVLFTREQFTIILVRCPERKTGTYAIPDNVDSIGKGAFAGCDRLTGVTIPDSVSRIGGRAFEGCGSLTNIAVAATNTSYSTIDGVLFNKAQSQLIRFPPGWSGSYSIPDGVTSIGIAFAGCTRLTSVALPASLANIGFWAFRDCSSLTNITVHDANAFYSSVDGVLCNKAHTQLIRCPPGRTGSYSIPPGVTNIGCQAFEHGSRLTDVTVPPSVTDVEVAAFAECTNLTAVYFRGNAPNLPADINRGCMPPRPTIFEHADQVTIYHLPGTTGWSHTFGGRPTAIWNPQTNTAANAEKK